MNHLALISEAWWDMRKTAPWRQEQPCDLPSPYKPEGSPFFAIKGLASPTRILIDSAHTWHIGFPGWIGYKVLVTHVAVHKLF